MPTAVSASASSLRVTGTTGWSSRANSSRVGLVTPSLMPCPLARFRNRSAPRSFLAATLANASSRGDPQRPVEAPPLPGAAGRALLVDEDQQRVAVAVQPHLADPLPVSGGLALHPVLAAAARPVRRPACRQGAVQRLVVHPREHEHLAGVVLLDDGGDQPRGVAAQQRGDLRGEVALGGVLDGGHAADCPCCGPPRGPPVSARRRTSAGRCPAAPVRGRPPARRRTPGRRPGTRSWSPSRAGRRRSPTAGPPSRCTAAPGRRRPRPARPATAGGGS